MFEMILGHLVGDYLLQNDMMAQTKSKNTVLGWIVCFMHCMFYTTSVCLMMKNYNLNWIIIVFISHFFIDKFSLANYWMNMMGKRTPYQWYLMFEAGEDKPEDVIHASFSSIVYCVVDNTMHILLMYYGWRYLYL